MKHQILTVSLLGLGLLGIFFGSVVQAREIRDPAEASASPTSDQSFVYDYKSGTFVRVHHERSATYPAGSMKINVGYDPEMTKVKESWPINVNRFLYRRPLDQ